MREDVKELYQTENAIIKSASLISYLEGLELKLEIDGNGWKVSWGDHLAKHDIVDVIECLLEISEEIKFEQIKDKPIRVKVLPNPLHCPKKIMSIGHFLKDDWTPPCFAPPLSKYEKEELEKAAEQPVTSEQQNS